MPNRTVKLLGYGFGSTDATIAVTLDGTEIFNGSVTTVNQSVPELPNLDLLPDTVELCTFELPVDFSGQKSMTCEVTNGTVIFAQIDANYCQKNNPVYTDSDYEVINDPASTNQEIYDVVSPNSVPTFSAEETSTLLSVGFSTTESRAILAAHGVSFVISSGALEFYSVNYADDARSNIEIDGVAKTPTHTGEYTGTYWWTLNQGSTLSYDLVVTAGLA